MSVQLDSYCTVNSIAAAVANRDGLISALAAAENDTLILGPGTYYIDTSAGFVPLVSVTIQGSDPSSSIIEQVGGEYLFYVATPGLTISFSNIHLTGPVKTSADGEIVGLGGIGASWNKPGTLTLNNCYLSNFVLGINIDGPDIVYGSGLQLTLTNCEGWGCRTACVQAKGTALLTVDNCYFHDTGLNNNDHCIYTRTATPIDIKNSTFGPGVIGAGVHTYHDTGAATSWLVSNCTFTGETNATILKGSSGIVGPQYNEGIIRDCSFHNSGIGCISNTLIEDCTFTSDNDVANFGVYQTESVPVATIRRCTFSGPNGIWLINDDNGWLIEDCVFTPLSAQGSGVQLGGGSTCTIRRCYFDDHAVNLSTNYGEGAGAIWSYSTGETLENLLSNVANLRYVRNRQETIVLVTVTNPRADCNSSEAAAALFEIDISVLQNELNFVCAENINSGDTSGLFIIYGTQSHINTLASTYTLKRVIKSSV